MTVRAVFIITGLSTGGSEMMLLKVLERIDRSRFDPHVISLTDKGEIGLRIEALRIPVSVVGMRPVVFSPFSFVRLVWLLRKLKPDFVHTWMYHADLLGGLAARIAGVRAVGWRVNHSNLDPRLNKRSTLWIVYACARLSSWLPRRILSCSEKARRVHIDAGYAESRIVVVPNGFDLGHFRPDGATRASVRAELGADSSTPLVGLVARNHPQKNIPGFIAAAAIVARSRPSVQFLLAGSGLDAGNPELQAAVRNSALAERIHFLGRRDDIPRLMSALDIFALSSHGEAFPNVVGEAMACGVPCVVTDVGDAAEIVGETGRIVPAGDAAKLAGGMLELLDLLPAERAALGNSARARVQEKYDIVRIVGQYADFHMSLLNGIGVCVG